MMSLSAHKIYGPKGIGALYIKREVSVQQIIFGGGHEWNLRSGTSNIPAVVGFAKAIELSNNELEKEQKRLNRMQKHILDSIKDIKGITLNGPSDLSQRLPGNINLSFDFINNDQLLSILNKEKIAVSSGASCASGKPCGSQVLRAIGVKTPELKANIRLSLGKFNSIEECDRFIYIVQHLNK